MTTKYPLIDREWTEGKGRSDWIKKERAFKNAHSCKNPCWVLMDCRIPDCPKKYRIENEAITGISTLKDFILHAALLIESVDENLTDLEDYGKEYWSELICTYDCDSTVGVETSDEGDGFHFYYGSRETVYELISYSVPEECLNDKYGLPLDHPLQNRKWYIDLKKKRL